MKELKELGAGGELVLIIFWYNFKLLY